MGKIFGRIGKIAAWVGGAVVTAAGTAASLQASGVPLPPEVSVVAKAILMLFGGGQ